jgi:hypothetical protein
MAHSQGSILFDEHRDRADRTCVSGVFDLRAPLAPRVHLPGEDEISVQVEEVRHRATALTMALTDIGIDDYLKHDDS